ncbi:cell wall-binding repeat-containing protein [Guptibacillus hwajinpoensis]|uniref:cell wall-binding repeat-containing protein n=1 Tax=Guptibacillus hwajinpoensis TaxID=208199 RepID=UPI003D014655
MKKAMGILTSLLLAGSLIGQPASAESNSAEQPQPSAKAPFDIKGFIGEMEPNNEFEDARETGIDYIAGGTLTDKDQDIYKLEITEEQRLDFLAVTEAHDSPFQFQVDVYDQNFEQVTPDSEEMISNYKGSFDQLKPGTYYFVVSDLNNVDNGETYYFYTFGEGMLFSDRLYGFNRYDTAVEIAKETFRENEAPHVVLATGSDFPDALAGAPLAYAKEAPILLTKTNQIPDDVLYAFDYFGVKEVTIIGGENAVSKKVENTLINDLSMKVNRIAGDDRYDTAAKIADELGVTSETAYVTYGGNYPDALSIASIAAMEGSPILLTKSNDIPNATSDALQNYSDSYAIGGPAVISDSVVDQLPDGERIAGADRYETSVNVAKELDVRLQSVNLATGLGFADALTGSVHAAVNEEPVILTRPNKLSTPAKKLFEDYGTNTFTIFGGPAAVDFAVDDEIYEMFID